MAKYECKVCGYIYNEQHASRSFEELSECPICNEGKENFVALDADNNPVEAVKEVKAEDDFFVEAEKEETVEEISDAVVVEDKVEQEVKTEEPFSMYKEIKDETESVVSPASDFVVERRQDFWTPVSANAEKKEEPVNNNTTGWTISNAMGSVEKVIGGEETTEDTNKISESVVEEVNDVAEEEEKDAFSSRIESFYSAAEPVGTSHIISEEEDEDTFRPLWNAGGGTVQRVIDPFNDKNDSVVKAENIGMVMPAEAPVVEEILGEEEAVEEAVEEVTGAVEEESVVEVADAVTEETVEEITDVVAEEIAAEDAVEDISEEVADSTEEAEEEILVDDIEDTVEDVVEVVAEENEDVTETIVEEVEEVSPADDLLASFGGEDEEEDDDFFTEMTMDAVMDMPEESHGHGNSGISEDEVFSAIDAIVFDDDVPEGGRVEVVSADGTEPVALWNEEPETEEVNSVEDKAESEDMDTFFFDEDESDEDIEEENVEEVTDDVAEEIVEEVTEDIAEEVTDDVAEDITEEATGAVEDDEEPFIFEDINEDFYDDSKEGLEAVTEEIEEETEAVVEEVTEAIAEDTVEETVETPTEEAPAEETPVVKGWSFLDDVVGAGVATGVGIAGVNFVTKSMDEVVDEEVTDEDIEEVFVDFAEENKADVNENEFKATLAEELFAQEPVEFKEDVPLAKQCDTIEEEKIAYCNNLEKILIVPAQLNPMPLPEGTEVEGRTVLGIASERPLVLDNPVFSTGDYNMVQYIPNSGLTSEDYQQADAIEVIVGHGNGIEKTINSKEDLRQVVNFLRLESDGCPIGIKMGAARIERDLEFCVFAKPDYVVLNNFDVVPLPYALHRATKYLNAVQSDMDIVIALDGAKDAEELAKIMAMGADVIALRNRPEDMIKMTEGLKKYARITGHYDVEDLNVKDLCTVDREIAEFTDIYHV